jgi:hemin uptake protein HemP
LRTIDERNENYYRADVDKLKPSPLLPAPMRLSSESLLGKGREIVITHNGREYRLRLTQNGKLILTA